MKSVIDNINKWTVGGVTSFYYALVANTYFILGNLLGLVTIFIFKPTMNNLVFFIIPIFLLMQSIMMQFHILPYLEEYSLKRFLKEYPKVLKENWRLLLGATVVILMIIFDVNILMQAETSRFLLTGVIITAFFLTNSLLYVFLIESRAEAKAVPLSKKIVSSLLLSYRLFGVTLVNVLYIGIALFSIQFVAVFYIVFIGGCLNLLIWKNLQRRFSLDLYFEQIIAQNNI